ncbi:arginase family protein [Leifsonia soli]|uniref:Agmatinase n=1 Tax=Leifsonia soli TaxID=582665 RepID=A0A852SZV2_9MICO|nr:agmatinase [Leifsonia soli]
MTIGRTAASILGFFALPRTVEEVLRRLTTDAAERSSLSRVIVGLREAGLLVPVASPEHVPPGATGLFGAPFATIAAALRTSHFDAIAVGVEYDAGASQKAGSRSAPDAIRRASGSLFTRADGRGMYDPVRGRRVLENVRLADIGNLSDTVQTRNGDMFERLEEFASACADRQTVSVAIGGDHSITFGLVSGHLRRRRRLGILHIDAHSDYLEPMHGDWRTSLHHGNVMSWLAGRGEIATIAQFGIRQLAEEDPVPGDKVMVWPGTSALRLDSGRVEESLDRSMPWYLSIDVDVLDPAFLPSTGTPLPGGLTPAELTQLIDLVCRGREIVGIDLVELIPNESDHSALLASEVLLRALDAVFRR